MESINLLLILECVCSKEKKLLEKSGLFDCNVRNWVKIRQSWGSLYRIVLTVSFFSASFCVQNDWLTEGLIYMIMLISSSYYLTTDRCSGHLPTFIYLELCLNGSH